MLLTSLQDHILEMSIHKPDWGDVYSYFLLSLIVMFYSPGVSKPWPMGRMWPRMAVNAAQHKIVNLLKTL